VTSGGGRDPEDWAAEQRDRRPRGGRRGPRPNPEASPTMQENPRQHRDVIAGKGEALRNLVTKAPSDEAGIRSRVIAWAQS